MKSFLIAGAAMLGLSFAAPEPVEAGGFSINIGNSRGGFGPGFNRGYNRGFYNVGLNSGFNRGYGYRGGYGYGRGYRGGYGGHYGGGYGYNHPSLYGPVLRPTNRGRRGCRGGGIIVPHGNHYDYIPH